MHVKKLPSKLKKIQTIAHDFVQSFVYLSKIMPRNEKSYHQ